MSHWTVGSVSLRAACLGTLALVLGGLPVPAGAQAEGSAGDVMVPLELAVGGLRFDDDLRLGDQAFVAAGLGVDLGPYVGLRGRYWRGVTDRFDAFQNVEGWSGEAQLSLGRVTAASPFIVLGYGRTEFDAGFLDETGQPVPDQDLLIAGAGFGVPLFDRSRFVVTLRDHMTSPRSFTESSPRDLRHSFAAGAGLTFLLFGSGDRPSAGGVAAAPAPAGAAPSTPVADSPAPSVPERPDTPERAVREDPGDEVVEEGTSARGDYQSDRTVLIPVPAEGELYVRYGPPPAVSPGGRSTVPAGVALAADSAALAGLVRRELARVLGPSRPEEATGDDLAALETRIVSRLVDSVAAGASDADLAALEARVHELAALVREPAPRTSPSTVREVIVAPGGADRLPARRPLLRGVAGRLGTMTVRDGGIGIGASVVASLGWLPWPALRPFVGVDAGRSSVRTHVGPSSVIGTVTNIAAHAGAYLDFRPIAEFHPSLSASLAGVGGDVDGEDEQDAELMGALFDPFTLGLDLGAHIAYRRLPFGYQATLGVRHMWAAARSRWAIEAGIRLPRETGEDVNAPGVRWVPAAGPPAGTPDAPGATDPADTMTARAERDAAAVGPDPELLARIEALERALDREAEARAAAEERAADVAAEEAAARERAVAERAATCRALGDLVGVTPGVSGVRRTDRGLEVVLGGGVFDVGSATLSPAVRSAVNRIAGLVRGDGPDLLVDGHTDGTGSAEANLDLSRRRAEAVRAGLLDAGVVPVRVAPVASGESTPLASNDTVDGRARNRRVEIVLVGLACP